MITHRIALAMIESISGVTPLALKSPISVVAEDSIDYLDLIQKLELKLGIVIPDSKLVEFKTVGDIVDYISENG